MFIVATIAVRLIEDVLRWLVLRFRSTAVVRAENLFLRRQLALYIERGVRPLRIDVASRVSLVMRAAGNHDPLASCGLEAAVATEVSTRSAADPGRAAGADPQNGERERLWGEERLANELFLKLGIRISPRTVRKYMPKRPPGQPRGDQRWSTFLNNHATAILSCDFFVAVTATFRMLYVFVVIEHGTRRLARVNVTSHPIATWTLQQLREVVDDSDNYTYLIHDRDAIFAKHLDSSIRALSIDVLCSPFASPKANAICERVIGTIRRECLDWMIPMSEAHLRSILRRWVAHYNTGRPHSMLGPGVPDPPRSCARSVR